MAKKKQDEQPQEETAAAEAPRTTRMRALCAPGQAVRVNVGDGFIDVAVGEDGFIDAPHEAVPHLLALRLAEHI